MARRRASKKKIKVDLDLPKDDKTVSRMYQISTVTVLIGLICIGFWFTNSSFLPTQNENPMFVNMYCSMNGAQGFDGMIQPSYVNNESCDILVDKPRERTWVSEGTWSGLDGKAKTFVVPGMSVSQLQGMSHPDQRLTVDCDASSDDFGSLSYEVSIWKDGESLGENWEHTGTAGESDGSCSIDVPHAEPGEYTFRVLPGTPPSSLQTKPDFQFDFTLTVMAFDGIPENMNNKSQWIGPELVVSESLSPLRPTIFLNFFGIGIFMMFFPASLYWDRVQRKINSMEEKFPDFLRDLAEYWKGGLSMSLAVQTLATSEYGALNHEVKKMANQISWGIAFEDVLFMFSNRVGTPLVKRAISLISEANKAGGKISDILVTAANDSREIKFLEGERARAIASYIAVIWVSFMVFLAVIVVLSKLFIPAIADSNSGSSGGGDAQIGNMQIRTIEPIFFLTVFYYGVTMQALGNGAMAGLMATGRFSNGMKHAGMMIVLSLLAFNFITFTPDLIGVPLDEGLRPSVGYIPI